MDAQAVAEAHLPGRLERAERAARRLPGLAVPAGIAAVLWWQSMLAQAAYGTELQAVLPGELRRLRTVRLQVMALFPLHLAGVRAPGLVDSRVLGQHCVRDTVCDARGTDAATAVAAGVSE